MNEERSGDAEHDDEAERTGEELAEDKSSRTDQQETPPVEDVLEEE